jgi:hypothetical protein
VRSSPEEANRHEKHTIDMVPALFYKVEDVPEDEEMPDAPNDRHQGGNMMIKKAIRLGGGVVWRGENTPSAKV